jgi:hypothetical protein
MSFLENARSEVLQIAGHLRGGFSISKELPIDLDAEMRRDGWIDIRTAAAISGLDVKFLRESTKIVKRWPKDPNDNRTWVKAEVAEQIRRDRSGAFGVLRGPTDPAVVRQRALDQILAEGAFGYDDMVVTPNLNEWDGGNRAPATETSAPVAITTAKVQAAAESRS